MTTFTELRTEILRIIEEENTGQGDIVICMEQIPEKEHQIIMALDDCERDYIEKQQVKDAYIEFEKSVVKALKDNEGILSTPRICKLMMDFEMELGLQ